MALAVRVLRRVQQTLSFLICLCYGSKWFELKRLEWFSLVRIVYKCVLALANSPSHEMIPFPMCVCVCVHIVGVWCISSMLVSFRYTMQGRKPSQDLMGSSAAMSGMKIYDKEWKREVYFLIDGFAMPQSYTPSLF